jgi:hypothetical protein
METFFLSRNLTDLLSLIIPEIQKKERVKYTLAPSTIFYKAPRTDMCNT